MSGEEETIEMSADATFVYNQCIDNKDPIDTSQTPLTLEDFECLDNEGIKMKRFEEIYVQPDPSDDDDVIDLNRLGKAINLVDINIVFAKKVIAGNIAKNGLIKLESLSINSGHIYNISCLKKLQNLKSFNFWSNNLKDHSIHGISLLTNLEKLYICENNLDGIGNLSALTKLKPTSGWNKGDKKRFGNSVYKFASLMFEPNPEADEFDDKVKKLLDFLEQDKEGVKMLVDKANGHVQVASSFHNGNTMLGGHHLGKTIIKSLGSLNLEIDFDIYADGNKFDEPE